MSTTQPIRNPALLQEFKNYYLYTSPNSRNHALCILGLNTALRITDILKLTWQDIYDFDEKHFRGHLLIKEQKTGKTALIALNAAVTEALLLLLKDLSAPPLPRNFIFISRKGTNCPIGRTQAFRIIKNAAAKVGLYQHISCHSLRKTFGYFAWQQGIAPAMLMNIYNHSSYQITKRYLGIEQDEKDRVFLNISL